MIRHASSVAVLAGFAAIAVVVVACGSSLSESDGPRSPADAGSDGENARADSGSRGDDSGSTPPPSVSPDASDDGGGGGNSGGVECGGPECGQAEFCCLRNGVAAVCKENGAVATCDARIGCRRAAECTGNSLCCGTTEGPFETSCVDGVNCGALKPVCTQTIGCSVGECVFRYGSEIGHCQ